MAASPFSAVPRAIRIALLIALALFIFTRGVLPAWSRILSDFPNYFTAARIVVAGDQVERLYDDAWFQQQIRAQGIDSLGQFTPFPPPTALLLIPLTSLAPLQAQRVVTLVSILALAAAISLLARVLAWSTLDAGIFVLLAGIGISNGMRLGQPYILMATLCIAGYYAWQRGRPLLAGALLGLFVPIKYYPILIVLCLGALRQWRVLLGAALAIGSVLLLSVLVMGVTVHQIFLQTVLGPHLSGHLGLPLSATVQSFDTLLGLLFIPDAARNPWPWFAAPGLQPLGVLLIKSVILLITTVSLFRLWRAPRPPDPEQPLGATIALLGIVALLLAPGTATYHFVLWWLPVGLMLRHLLAAGARGRAYLLLAAYTLIGFWPYQLTQPFEGRGGLSVLAFPRLFLELIMFIVSAWVLARISLSRSADAIVAGGT